MLFELLSLGRLRAKEGAASEEQVRAILKEGAVHDEELLFGAQSGADFFGRLAKPAQQPLAGSIDLLLRSEEREFVIERFTLPGEE